MKRITKKILSLLLMLAMVMGSTTSTLAASALSASGVETEEGYVSRSSNSTTRQMADEESTTFEPVFRETIGVNNSKAYENALNYLDDTRQQKTVSGSISLAINNKKINVLLSLEHAGFSEKMDVSGEVYVLHGNGYFDEKLILGSINGSSKLNIPLFKILNESEPILTIMLEDIASGELYELTFVLPHSVFESLFSFATITTTEYEKELENSFDDSTLVKEKLLEKVMSLLQPGKNYKSSTNITLTRSQSHQSFKSTDSNSGSSASVTELQNFCTSINNSPNAGITPSTAMQTILSQTGWKKYYSTFSHFYIMHSVINSSTEYLICLTVGAVSNSRPNTTSISAGYGISGCCSISYNPITKVAELLFYNTGVRLEDALVAIELLGGTTNFYLAHKSSSLTGSTSLRDILLAVLNDLGYSTAIWSVLQSSNDSSPTVNLGSDSYQNNMFGGLVRAVANEAASGYSLWGQGENIHIIGYHYNDSTKQYVLHTIRWSFTAYSLF